MKRIIAALKGKVEKSKMERKVSRINRAIDTAIDNAQEEIDRIEEQKSNLLAALSDSSEVNAIINSISMKIDEQEEQQAIITRLENVRQYIEEEIDVEEQED